MMVHTYHAILAQLVEYLHDMQGVTGSSPVDRTIFLFKKYFKTFRNSWVGIVIGPRESRSEVHN